MLTEKAADQEFKALENLYHENMINKKITTKILCSERFAYMLWLCLFITWC